MAFGIIVVTVPPWLHRELHHQTSYHVMITISAILVKSLHENIHN
jgi:hypothetical protein